MSEGLYWRLPAILLALGLVSGCGEKRSTRAVATAAPSTSTTPASTTTSSTSAPVVSSAPTLGSLLTDPGYVPSGPADVTWYFRRDDPATPDNEAARDLARALATNGMTESWVYEHLLRGGPFAIYVGGANHERDTPTRRSSWMAPCAEHVQATRNIPGIQVDYKNWAGGNTPIALVTYTRSLAEGVLRTSALLDKALSAGAGEVRLYGHSKGGDVVQEVTWLRQSEPRFTMAVSMGIPIWSAAIPDRDPSTLYAGLFRLGRQRDYGGKLVLFIRFSDRASRGELLPAGTFPGPGHDYSRVLATPGVMARFEQARFNEPIGFADRTFGVTYDY